MNKYDKLFAYCDFFYKEASSSDYMRERYRNKREQVIKELGGKCVSCGSKNKLELDHKDRKKKTMRMADLHSVSDQKLKEELKNIQLLCKPCHDKKSRDSWDFGSPKPSHGTYWMYRKHKCRCDKCIEAFRARHREWNKTRSDRTVLER